MSQQRDNIGNTVVSNGPNTSGGAMGDWGDKTPIYLQDQLSNLSKVKKVWGEETSSKI